MKSIITLKGKEFNWGPGLFLIIYQTLLLISAPFYFYYCSVQWSTVLLAVFLYYTTGISITGGYHRYYAHRTYKTNSFVEFFLLFFGAMSAQGSALRWAYDHRIHHAYVDTDSDPYSINKGFLYAHFLWILEKPKNIEPKVVSDLMNNKMVMFQHRFSGTCFLLSNLIVFFLAEWFLKDIWGVFFIVIWLRMFALHHSTWFINSLAHTWGEKPFCKEQTAADNYFLSVLTFGEGYHNYHHTFANDYRNGVRWYHFDPTKWVIWSLNKLGLAYNLKRMDAATIKKRMVQENKTLLLEKLTKLWYVKKEELEQQVHEISDRVVTKIAELNKLKEHYHQAKKNSQRNAIKEIKLELKNLKKSLREDWRLWMKLSSYIMNMEPLTT
jgi:stearoyl-CoA desaturase (Delta-9 desaturase)